MAATLGTTPKPPHASPPPSGHNGISEDIFLNFVSECAKIEEKLEEAKSARRSVRKRAKAAGIDLGHMDAVVRMADWGPEEVREFFGTRTRYAIWLRLPLGQQADMFAEENEKPVGDAEVRDAAYWSGKGFQAGVKGALPQPPSECHPQFHPDFKHGWERGQERNAPKKLQAVN